MTEVLASPSLAMLGRRAVTPCRCLSKAAGVQVLLANEQLGQDVSLSKLAEKTGRFSGSDLRALCTAAAMRPVRELLEASGKSARVRHLVLSPFHHGVPEHSARCARDVSRFPQQHLVGSQSSTRGASHLCRCCNADAVMSAPLIAVLLGVLVWGRCTKLCWLSAVGSRKKAQGCRQDIASSKCSFDSA